MKSKKINNQYKKLRKIINKSSLEIFNLLLGSNLKFSSDGKDLIKNGKKLGLKLCDDLFDNLRIAAVETYKTKLKAAKK